MQLLYISDSTRSQLSYTAKMIQQIIMKCHDIVISSIAFLITCNHNDRSSAVGAAMTTRSPAEVVNENLLHLICFLTDVVSTSSGLSSISVTVQFFSGIVPDSLLSYKYDVHVMK